MNNLSLTEEERNTVIAALFSYANSLLSRVNDPEQMHQPTIDVYQNQYDKTVHLTIRIVKE